MFVIFICVLLGDSWGSVELYLGWDKYVLGENNFGYIMKEFCLILSIIF